MPASVNVNGPLIEHYRKTRACLSRRQAAEKLGMSEAGLYYIERGRQGKCRTQPDTLKRIAQLLEVDPQELAESAGAASGVPAFNSAATLLVLGE